MALGCVHLFHTQDAAGITRLKAAMLRYGINLEVHHHIHQLGEAIAAQAHEGAPSVVLLAASFEQNSEAARMARKANSLAIVIALFPRLQDDELHRALCHEIDACWTWSLPAQTVAAKVQRFIINLGASRSGGPPIERVGPGDWRLVSAGWEVQSPDGRRISLTSAERALMLALHAAPNRKLSHAELADEIVKQQGRSIIRRSDMKAAALDVRRLSVMVSRLRKKFLAVGLETPVRTLRGVGYELTADF